MVNIVTGCPDEDLARIAECDPRFSRGKKLLSISNLEYIRDHEKKALRWVCEHFPVHGKRDPHGTILNVGVFTAIVLTYKLDGDKAWEIWKHYLDGTFPGPEYQPLSDLWRGICFHKLEYTGDRGQNNMFQRAIHAYLVARDFPITRKYQAYEDGAHYQISKGMVSEPKPKKGKGTKTTTLTLSVMATATAAE